MKDIVLTARQQKRELWWLLGAFVVANLCNAWAIVEYHAPASEMFTSIFYVLIFTIVLYAFSAGARLIYHQFRKAITTRKQASHTS